MTQNGLVHLTIVIFYLNEYKVILHFLTIFFLILGSIMEYSLTGVQ